MCTADASGRKISQPYAVAADVYKYDASGSAQPSTAWPSAHRGVGAYAPLEHATAKQLRHASSYQEHARPVSAGLLSQSAVLSRSQLAEQKHIQRQNSMTEKSSRPRSRPASAERTRAGSAHASLTREPSSASLRRLSSIDRTSSAFETYKFAGSGGNQSTAKPASRSVTSAAQAQTIPAYNPSYGRSSLTDLNSKSDSNLNAPGSLKSHKSLTSSYSSAPAGSLDSTTSSNAPTRTCSQPQASYLRSLQASIAKQPESKARASGASGSVHSQPRRSSSNPMALLEMSGHYFANIGSHIRR